MALQHVIHIAFELLGDGVSTQVVVDISKEPYLVGSVLFPSGFYASTVAGINFAAKLPVAVQSLTPGVSMSFLGTNVTITFTSAPPMNVPLIVSGKLLF